MSVVEAGEQLYLAPLRFLLMGEPLVSTAHSLLAAVLRADPVLHQGRRGEGGGEHEGEESRNEEWRGEKKGGGGRRKRGE